MGPDSRPTRHLSRSAACARAGTSRGLAASRSAATLVRRDTSLMPLSKETTLRAIIRSFDRVLVAYSGGVDSAYLLKVARQELGDRAVAVIGVSPSLMDEELADAR